MSQSNLTNQSQIQRKSLAIMHKFEVKTDRENSPSRQQFALKKSYDSENSFYMNVQPEMIGQNILKDIEQESVIEIQAADTYREFFDKDQNYQKQIEDNNQTQLGARLNKILDDNSNNSQNLNNTEHINNSKSNIAFHWLSYFRGS